MVAVETFICFIPLLPNYTTLHRCLLTRLDSNTSVFCELPVAFLELQHLYYQTGKIED